MQKKIADLTAGTVGEAIVAAMTAGGIELLFFCSGSELAFLQEVIAKAQALGSKAPRLVLMTHEYPALNAALGFAAVSGKPAAATAHADVGTLHFGSALHTAFRAGLPVLIAAGAPPAGYPGSMAGARDAGHLWLQQTYDQNGIVRQFVKWEHRLEVQDDPGLLVSRALQVAQTQPSGAAYLSIPRELLFRKTEAAGFRRVDELGIPRTPFPDPAAIEEITARLLLADNPFVVVSGSGRNPGTVLPLVELCEMLGVPVVDAASRAYLCFPFNHPLYQRSRSISDADFVLVLDADIPWVPGPNAPGPGAFIAVTDLDPIKIKIPTFEFPANVRLVADPLHTISAIRSEAERVISASDRGRFRRRAGKWAEISAADARRLEEEALSLRDKAPIDPRWLSYQICQALDQNTILIDDTMSTNPLYMYLNLSRPGSYFRNPGSAGGWAPGTALGAKLAAPERDVVAVTGDGFYLYSSANAALWASKRYDAPFLTVIYQNRSYSTGTSATARSYPNGYAAAAGFEGGYLDPPIDFAKEAAAAGAFGENVFEPSEVGPALRRGLRETRNGLPAVVSIRLPRLLQAD